MLVPSSGRRSEGHHDARATHHGRAGNQRFGNGLFPERRRGLVALFAEDATLESYLVSRVFKRKEGVCRGRTEIRELALALSRRGRLWGGHEPPIVRGNTVVIEHRSASSDAEKFSVDIIEVKDGRIQSLRAYAGWRAIMALTGGAGADAAPT